MPVAPEKQEKDAAIPVQSEEEELNAWLQKELEEMRQKDQIGIQHAQEHAKEI